MVQDQMLTHAERPEGAQIERQQTVFCEVTVDTEDRETSVVPLNRYRVDCRDAFIILAEGKLVVALESLQGLRDLT